MQTTGTKPLSSDRERPSEPLTLRRPRSRDLPPLLTGAGCALAAAGAFLALTDTATPLRGPLTLFLLIAAPGAAIAAALRGTEPWGRLLVSVAGALAVDLLVAQTMLAFHLWSAAGGVLAVLALSSLMLLPVPVRRLRGRTARKRIS